MKMRLVAKYRRARDKLIAERHRVFPLGTRVYVDHDGHQVAGKVVYPHGAPPDKVSVKLGRGSVWYFEIASVELSRVAG